MNAHETAVRLQLHCVRKCSDMRFRGREQDAFVRAVTDAELCEGGELRKVRPALGQAM